MVTKLSDGRGQIAIKAHSVTDDWERLARAGAKRNGQTLADYIVDLTTAAAQAALKGEPVIPTALPVRLEDIATRVDEVAQRLATEQQASIEQLRREQAEHLDRMQRQMRRGRWRR